MAKVVVRKASKEKPVKQDPEKWVSHNFEFRHQFLVGLKMMEGGEPVDGVPTWEEVQDEIRELLKKRFPNGHFTPSGGYLLIHEEGRVSACYPNDFDYETMNRKPGTHPPLYTLSQEEQKEVGVLQRIERESKNPNHLARNPTNLLTTQETDRLRKIRAKKILRDTVDEIYPQADVEWTEDDAGDEELAERETAKLLKKLPAKPQGHVRRPPAKLRRKS